MRRLLLLAGCAATLYVTGAESVQGTSMGVFTVVNGVVRGDRPVYQNGEDKYLFYWPGTNWWMIGANFGENIGNVYGAVGAACPEDTDGWQVSANGDWSAMDIEISGQTGG